MTEVIDPPVGPEAPEGKPQKGRRRITFWIGLGLILAGLGILAWLAWEIWGTTWISQREERHEVRVFESCRTTVCGGPPALLEIPRFGSGYVVPINDGTSSDVLSKGVGHFTGTGPGRTTIQAGQPGNYALAGHRITHGQPFADLPNLIKGDLVYVITHKWTYKYVLDTNAKDLNVSFTSSWVLGMDPVNPVAGGPQALQTPYQCPGQSSVTAPCIITLTTCSELFHTDNRMIVFGHLVGRTPTDSKNPTKISQ